MKPINLETSRLLLRPYSANDRGQFLALNCDLEVRCHMNGPLTRQTADKRFNHVLTGQTDGRGASWAIIEKGTGAHIGHAFLELSDSHPFHELGFLFFKSFWGRGYGTETALRLVEYCLRDAGLPGLSASVDCDHAPSIRVLEKVGLKRERVAVDDHGPFFIYSIKRKLEA